MIARLLVAFALLVLCTAPTPGANGGCGGDDLDDPADVRAYCAEREQLVCVRRYLRIWVPSRCSLIMPNVAFHSCRMVRLI